MKVFYSLCLSVYMDHCVQVTADPTEAHDSRPKPARSSLHFQACLQASLLWLW